MKQILYVEDNADTANAVRIILNKEGYATDIAATGKEGLAKIGETYDLILLDVMLPDMTGWDIFNKVKGKVRAKFAFLSAIPVSQERLDQLMHEGVSDYITKPFTKADLIARVQKILGAP